MRSSDVLKLKIEKDEMKPSSSNQPLSTGLSIIFEMIIYHPFRGALRREDSWRSIGSWAHSLPEIPDPVSKDFVNRRSFGVPIRETLIFRNNKSHDSAVESWESGNSELSQNSSSNHGKARQPRNPNFSRSFLDHLNRFEPLFSVILLVTHVIVHQTGVRTSSVLWLAYQHAIAPSQTGTSRRQVSKTSPPHFHNAAFRIRPHWTY